MTYKKQNKTKFLNGNYALIPILFVLCIVPLLMRLYFYYPGLTGFSWRSDSTQEADIFLHCKAVALIFSAVIMFFILITSIYFDYKNNNNNRLKLKHAKWIIFVLLFGILAFFSTIFSKYRSFGFSGFLDQFESIWVVLSYCIISIYTFYFIKTKSDIKIIKKGLFFFLIIMCTLGLFQLLGMDFWQSDLGKSIFVPAKYEEAKNSLSFDFSKSGNHQVYLTLFNPNYVGVFITLLLPISTMLCVGGKTLQQKIAWGILTVALFLCALGSGSKAFLLALIIVACIGIFIFIRTKLKLLPFVIIGITVFISICFGYMTYSKVNLFDYVKNALIPRKNAYIVEDFIIEPDRVTLKYDSKQLTMQCDFDPYNEIVYILATDENGKKINQIINEKGEIGFDDERFNDVTLQIYTSINNFPYIIETHIDNKIFRFSYQDNSYIYINNIYKADPIVHAESAIFTNYDSLFTRRGYIWSRSIPLLKNCLFLGVGADAFGLVFPHNDYVARANAGYQNQLNIKPHNIYLQAGIQYGVPALICYLIVLLMYIIQTLKFCWKADFKDSYNCLALGLLLGIIGYCIMGISNDSCVAVTPIAWVILGLGYSLNYILKKEKTQV